MNPSLLEEIIKGFELFIGFFAGTYIVSYILLAILSYYAIIKHVNARIHIHEDVLIKSDDLIGVSVIAPAFNEASTIIYNVKSLMSLSYPKFEVIIVNDGSSDDTLAKLIKEFKLVKVDFFYQEHIKTQMVRGHYKSTSPVYSNLLVVDKENGGSKADASNAGINSSQYPLFLCTDVDCILKKDTILKLAKPFMEATDKKVIATGAGIRISNSCEVKEGYLTRIHFPKHWYPRFQEIEYIRAFLFGRMAWGQINSLLLVSGGLGMFDKNIVIQIGGYWHKSLGEDMELITRMRKYMHEKKEKFIIKYIPESLCWTEVPGNVKDLAKQRTRWARGLIQTMFLHKGMLFNPKYGRTAFVILPYFLLFEFLVPIVELLGLIVFILGLIFLDLDYTFFIEITIFVYLFYLTVTMISLLFDEILYKNYANTREIVSLIGISLIEPIFFHPVNSFSYLRGYWNFLINKKQKWGSLKRQGYLIET
ncbi:MAG: glycosyl transferase family 2 [Flavobacteriales bacterium CG_4_9_14_3_um_filter_40_17]|nr:MAG: glycosyl transferase family 2 [Flavobacteriales bacterium CG_4_9_14_3_um_filter_40_17]